MEVRRYEKIPDENTSTEGLLRRFDTKNFVKINQKVLDMIDNKKPDKMIKEEMHDSSEEMEVDAEPSIASDPMWEEEKNSRIRFNTPSSRKRVTRGPLRRSSRRIAKRKEQSEAQMECDDEQSEMSRQINMKEESPDCEYDAEAFLHESLRTVHSPSTGSQNSKSSGRAASAARSSGSPIPIQPKRRKSAGFVFPKMSEVDSRSARYGWAIHDISNVPIICKGDPAYPLDGPDDYTLYNDRKTWATEYTMCIGQKNLCKWL